MNDSGRLDNPMSNLALALREIATDPKSPFPRGLAEVEFEYRVEHGAPAMKLRVRGVDPRALEETPPLAALGEPAEGEAGFGLKFNTPGHCVVALMAQEILSVEQPGTLQALIDLLTHDPLERGGLDAMAVWPDEIKNERPETRSWHYVNTPYTPGQAERPPVPTHQSILTVLPEQLAILENSQDVGARNDALAFVLHLVGDIHQPLHTITLFNDEFPDGDKGGNKFKLAHGGNMHSLWDDTLATKKSQIPGRVADLLERYPRSAFTAQLAVPPFVEWMWEGYQIGTEAYSLIMEESEDDRATSEYRGWARTTARRQAALGAYRLADLLADCLSG